MNNELYWVVFTSLRNQRYLLSSANEDPLTGNESPSSYKEAMDKMYYHKLIKDHTLIMGYRVISVEEDFTDMGYQVISVKGFKKKEGENG